MTRAVARDAPAGIDRNPARILILSSWVGCGHVGLSAAVPILHALGHTVTQIPTVMLSNHPAWPRAAGTAVPPDRIGAMLDALDANGLLAGHDAVLVGYLPTSDHVAAACAAVDRMRAHDMAPSVIIDPVLGDDPTGLYVPAAAAEAIRDSLLPVADILTPNRFELGWLSGLPVGSVAQALTAAEALRRASGPSRIHVTSVPVSDAETGVLSIGDGPARLWRTPRLGGVPHGAGDVFSAMVAAGVPLRATLGYLQAIVSSSLGADHLRIIEAARVWTNADPVTINPADIAKES